MNERYLFRGKTSSEDGQHAKYLKVSRLQVENSPVDWFIYERDKDIPKTQTAIDHEGG